MLRVIKPLKRKNKIFGYVCRDGAETVTLSKRQMSQCIDEGQVINAKKQTYLGKEIIRVNYNTGKCIVTDMTPEERQNKVAKIAAIMGVAELTDSDFLLAKVRGDKATVGEFQNFEAVCDAMRGTIKGVSIKDIDMCVLGIEEYNTIAYYRIAFLRGNIEPDKRVVQVSVSLALDIGRIVAQIYINSGSVAKTDTQKQSGGHIYFNDSKIMLHKTIGYSSDFGAQLIRRIEQIITGNSSLILDEVNKL